MFFTFCQSFGSCPYKVIILRKIEWRYSFPICNLTVSLNYEKFLRFLQKEKSDFFCTYILQIYLQNKIFKRQKYISLMNLYLKIFKSTIFGNNAYDAFRPVRTPFMVSMR